ncbi:EutN/CcmL family microcompartment protein [Clostridium sp. WILCCON 0269]|jgi:ethanolamine utilization protein EutN|uniref:Predicted microcompartment shellprotein n=4 Tax=Clostridium TaxID=1485 RepID=A5N6G9_CLOK5|nr:EutN/CcmL family microcompartment protein [Clostridium kluyveri]APM38232.1 ethanolamine utilization protein EutN [Clostridium kluyveri]EDK32900.1 Predicted microcompartment shellprotein [Clostridium kluyveri DSM 555]UZQ51755.1 EutN/CcmL family microcompartment protein [Clostridium kluyveri]BAH05813.1 hypothetical protein CKR_0762 [Clostridium kluyveri NBRC 12016]
MFLAKVVGNVVSTQKHEKLIGNKLLIVKKLDEKENIIQTEPMVAIDTVGAGINEIVIVVTGSGARKASNTIDIPTDASIVGIVDSVEWNESLI